MKITKFEEIISWQKGQELARFVYLCFKNCKDFPFKDQIQRACVSISNNIAEGFERMGDNELARFLIIAKGSCGEFRSMLYLAKDLSYMSEDDFKKAYNLSIDISKLLSAFIISIKRKK